jgi:hypothetical protein
VGERRRGGVFCLSEGKKRKVEKFSSSLVALSFFDSSTQKKLTLSPTMAPPRMKAT